MDIEAVIDAVTKFLDDDTIIETLVEIVDTDTLLEEVDNTEIARYAREYLEVYEVFEDDQVNEAWFECNEIIDHIDLDDVTQQVTENNTPEELYGNKYMLEYFVDNYENDIIEKLREDEEPEEVYTPEQLAQWAEENGYVKKVEEGE